MTLPPERLHLAAHSHHLWPDVTRDAMLACWDDAARLLDHKWDRIFGEVLPESTRDDRDPSAPSEGEASEEWLKRNVPPHHG